MKVLLRPYRGAPFIQEIPVTIPAQTTRGSLELVVSGADFLNRNVQSLAATSQGQLPGLEELIQLTNRERHNDRLYATLLQSTPTMLVEDKELPNVPVSAINVLDQRQNPGNAQAAAAVDGRGMVGRNASGDCGPAHADDYGEVSPRLKRSFSLMMRRTNIVCLLAIAALLPLSVARRTHALLAANGFLRIPEGHRQGRGRAQRRQASPRSEIRLLRRSESRLCVGAALEFARPALCRGWFRRQSSAIRRCRQAHHGF